jgi:hypothetical protein
MEMIPCTTGIGWCEVGGVGEGGGGGPGGQGARAALYNSDQARRPVWETV